MPLRGLHHGREVGAGFCRDIDGRLAPRRVPALGAGLRSPDAGAARVVVREDRQCLDDIQHWEGRHRASAEARPHGPERRGQGGLDAFGYSQAVMHISVHRQPDDGATGAAVHLAAELATLAIEECAVDSTRIGRDGVRHQRDHATVVRAETECAAAVGKAARYKVSLGQRTSDRDCGLPALQRRTDAALLVKQGGRIYCGRVIVIDVARCVGPAERGLDMIATLTPVVAGETMTKKVVTIECDTERAVAPAVAGTGAQNAIAPGDIAAEDAGVLRSEFDIGL